MSSPTSETITSPHRIGLLLKELSKKRVGISVVLLGSRRVFTSTLLDVNEEKQTIALDEFIPLEGNKLFKRGAKFKAEGKARNVSTSFESEIIELSDDAGLPYYTAQLPSSVEYGQQRKNYRVYISLSNSIDITLLSESGQEVTGRITDLSQGGAGISTPNDLSLEPGDIFEDCKIQLQPNQEISCKAIIRYYHYSSQSGDWRGGIEFFDIQSKDQQTLRACIMERERMALRIRPES